MTPAGRTEVGKVYAMGGLLGRNLVRAVASVSFTLDADRPEIFTVSASRAAARPRSGA
jgi:hypothetical protein